MIAGVLIGLGVFFYLLVLLSVYGNIFLIFGIGLTGAGLSLVLFSITVKNNWIGFKRVQGFPTLNTIIIWVYRLVLLGIGILSLYGASGFWLDFPSYINKNYTRLEGVPTKITYEEPSKGQLEGNISVTINNKTLSLDSSPKYPIKQMEGHRFEIIYLPKTEWIINYKIYPKGK